MQFAACAGLLVAGGSPLWFYAHVSAEQTHNLHLTHIQPHAVIAVIAVPDAVLQRVPSLLLLPVTQISNETLTPGSVYAYLTCSDPKGSHRLARLVLGQSWIFPTNQPGAVTRELSEELQEILTQSPD